MTFFSQSPTQAVDVTFWQRDAEFAAYPEGARDKTLLYCSENYAEPFLKSGHRYLFKLSQRRHPEQFWVEIFAYLLGKYMDIEVPKAFVAYDSRQKQYGALIEWFLQCDRYYEEIYIPGGDYCQQYLFNFDRKKGAQHNFLTIVQIFTDLEKKHAHLSLDWQMFWAKTFTFDALLGNTDRHQDNWGIIAPQCNKQQKTVIAYDKMRIAPVFDNGTSMGYEIAPQHFAKYDDYYCLNQYVAKGWHHMRWREHDLKPMRHDMMLKIMIHLFPNVREIMLHCLQKVDIKIFQKILQHLTSYPIAVSLSPARAAFMLKLLTFRHQRLLTELTKEFHPPQLFLEREANHAVY